MKLEQQGLIYKLKEQRSARKYLAIAVCLIAVLTVFAVFWSLRISGLTLGETATETDATGTDATATDGEEESGRGGEIAAANEESGIMLLSSSPSGTQSDDPADYYLAYTVDGVPSAGNYLIYTYSEGVYYVLNKDGSLSSCTPISSIAEATDDGPYYVTSTGTIVYGTSTTAASAYSAAQWTLAQYGSDSSSYTITNTSDTSKYVAAMGDATIEDGFSARTGEVNLSGDFTLTYTFTNFGDLEKSGDNFNNYIVEINNGNGVYIDVRADNYGWLSGATDGAELAFGSSTVDWSTWLAKMTAGTECTVTITRSENEFKFTCVAADVTFTASVISTDFDGCSANVYLTGEQCELTNVVYTYTQDGGSTYTNSLTSGVSALVSELAGYVTITNQSAGTAITKGNYAAVVSGASATWNEGGTATVFYFAAVRTTADNYHFTDAVTLTDAAAKQDESYVVYTQIDGSLLECTDISSSSYSNDDKALLSAGVGVYIWSYDSYGEPVFKFTTGTDDNDVDYFDDYRWTLNSSNASSTTGSGTYTIYNGANGDYLAYAQVGTETLESGATTAGTVLSNYGTNTYSITIDAGTIESGAEYAQFSIKVSPGKYPNRYIQVTTPYVPLGTEWSTAGGCTASTGTYSYTCSDTGTMTLNEGDELTVTVTTAATSIEIVYYNNTTAQEYVYSIDLSDSSNTNYNFGYANSGSVTYISSAYGEYTIITITSANPTYGRLAGGKTKTTLTVSAGNAYEWTAVSNEYSLIAQIATDSAASAEIDWVSDTTAGGTATGTATETLNSETVTNLAGSRNLALTFSLARVREYKVYFDPTDGNVNYGTTSSETSQFYLDADTLYGSTRYGQTLTTYADAVGNSYVDLPYATYRSTGNGDTGASNIVLQGWYDIYGYNNDANETYAPSVTTGNGYYSCYDSTADRSEWDYTTWQYSTIQIVKSTVFYGDWEVSSYDIVTGKESGVLADASNGTNTGTNGYGLGGVSTNSFITTELFDFSDLFNLYSTSMIPDSTTYLTSAGHAETWYIEQWGNNSILGSPSLGFAFIASGSGNLLSRPSRAYSGNNLINSQNSSSDERTAGIVASIYSQSGETINILDYLFGGTDTTDSITTYDAYSVSDGTGLLGKTYVGTADYLFQYNDENGYYYYDASRNAAFYNQSDERFYLYSYTTKINTNGSESDFIPFTYVEEGKNADTALTNYWFGMSTEIEFSLPDEVGEVTNELTAQSKNEYTYGNQSMGNNMIFKFIGDDDVWVYVDDVLILDLGGIHGQVYGEIDFSTGLVTIVNNLDTNYYYAMTYDATNDVWETDTELSHMVSLTSSDTITFTGTDNTGNVVTSSSYTASTLTFAGTGRSLFLEEDSKTGVYTVASLTYDYTDKDGSSVMTTYSMLEADPSANILDLGLTTAEKAEVTASGGHVLNMYYLERGAGQSNLAILLNISPSYGLKMSKVDKNNTSTSLVGTQFTFYDVTDYLDESSFEGVSTVLAAIDARTSSTYEATALYPSYTSSTAQATYTITCYCDTSGGNTCTCSGTCGCQTAGGSTTCQCNCDACEAYLQVYGLRQRHTYYIVETTVPDGYPEDIAERVILKLEVESDGSMTLTVMEYSSGSWIEGAVYTIDEDGKCTNVTTATDLLYDWYVLETTDDTTTPSTNTTIEAETVTITNANTGTSRSYIEWLFTVQNRTEYELPVTGSVGISQYRNAGITLVLVSVAGLLMIAFYRFVWVQKLCTNKNIKGYTKDGRKRVKRGKRFTRTRDHPRQRRNPMRNDGMREQTTASMSSANGGMERRRATGPGTG